MDGTAIAEQMGRTGLCVVPGFLAPAPLRATCDDLDAVVRAGGFARAGTGQGEGMGVRDDVRRDTIAWLDRDGASPAQAALWVRIDELLQAFNRTLYLGLVDFEGHYAIYPDGGFYRRHLDCFRDDDRRVVSLVLYLNRNWQPADGGVLRVFRAGDRGRAVGDPAAPAFDVAPRGGTLACFLSRESEHEVLPSHATRASFTGWFRGPPT